MIKYNLVCKCGNTFESWFSTSKEFDSLFKAIYTRIDEFKNPSEAILILSKYQYEYGFVLDKEICIMAMLIQLIETTKKQLL